MTSAQQLLSDALPAHLFGSEEKREAASKDTSGHLNQTAAVLVTPETVAQVQQVARIASATKTPLIVRGAGSGLSGGISATDEAIILSTAWLDRIRELNPTDHLIVAEAGVTTAAVDEAAAAHNLMYAPDPASYTWSSIGGNIATNAGGLRCVKYGVTRDSVLGLEVVLADGTLLELGHRTLKGVTGYDLTGLFVGSEGTLGIVTAAKLRLRPRPAKTSTALIWAPSLTQAGNIVAALATSGVQPAMLELLSPGTLRSIDSKSGTKLAARANSLLLVQTDGLAADAELDVLRRAVGDLGEFETLDAEQADYYIELRRTGRNRHQDRWTLSEDLVVPRSQLVAMLEFCEATATDLGLEFHCVAHAGDGNLHLRALGGNREVDAAAPASLHTWADRAVRQALALGGSLTGEHGVGVLKRPG